MFGAACCEESAMESHAMRLQSQVSGLLVEDVFEMLQHSFFVKNRLECTIAANDERSFKRSIVLESRR